MARAGIAACLGALVACGSSQTTSSADPQAFDTTAQSISSAASAYRSSTATMPDAAACSAADASYEAQVRPLVQRMHDLAGAMDARMASMMGQAAAADMGCATDAISAELDRHHATACAGDLIAVRAEAARHAQAMAAWTDHQRVRAEEMGTMMGGGGMMGTTGGTTGTCQRSGDGTFTLQ